LSLLRSIVLAQQVRRDALVDADVADNLADERSIRKLLTVQNLKGLLDIA